MQYFNVYTIVSGSGLSLAGFCQPPAKLFYFLFLLVDVINSPVFLHIVQILSHKGRKMSGYCSVRRRMTCVSAALAQSPWIVILYNPSAGFSPAGGTAVDQDKRPTLFRALPRGYRFPAEPGIGFPAVSPQVHGPSDLFLSEGHSQRMGRLKTSFYSSSQLKSRAQNTQTIQGQGPLRHRQPVQSIAEKTEILLAEKTAGRPLRTCGRIKPA